MGHIRPPLGRVWPARARSASPAQHSSHCCSAPAAAGTGSHVIEESGTVPWQLTPEDEVQTAARFLFLGEFEHGRAGSS